MNEPQAPEREELEQIAAHISEDELGQPITLEDGVRLLKAVKVMAAADGLSGIEKAGIRSRMEELGVPTSIRDEIEAYDVSQISLEQALEQFPTGGRLARYLIIAAISVASVDGYTTEERDTIADAAHWVGLTEQYVHVLEASERVARMVELLQNPELAEAWQDLGHALLNLEAVQLEPDDDNDGEGTEEAT